MKTYNWNEANEICKNFNFAGHTDWRLPTVKELLSLVDYECGHPFQSVQSSNYWSATTYAGHTTNAWIVNMYSGHVYNDYKTSNYYYVWPVRSYMRDITAPRFEDNRDGTITDHQTALMWLKYLEDVK